MPIPRIVFIIVSCISLFSCSIGRQAFYVSPLNGLTNQYRTTPLKKDSIKSATYLNASISGGGDNEGGTDSKFSFTTGVSRSHNFRNFQARYGAGVALGNYQVKPYDSIGNNETVNYRIINQNAGNYFFGAGMVEGAINFVRPNKLGEWRVIGLESSFASEFGSYLNFRKDLPDSAATLIIRNPFFGTAGLFTEFVNRSGKSLYGLKFGYGIALGCEYRNLNIPDSYYLTEVIRYRYVSLAFHLSKDRYTGFFQGVFAGKSNSAVFGINYRL
jgi:hypothetical protein